MEFPTREDGKKGIIVVDIIDYSIIYPKVLKNERIE